MQHDPLNLLTIKKEANILIEVMNNIITMFGLAEVSEGYDKKKFTLCMVEEVSCKCAGYN